MRTTLPKLLVPTNFFYLYSAGPTTFPLLCVVVITMHEYNFHCLFAARCLSRAVMYLVALNVYVLWPTFSRVQLGIANILAYCQ